MHNTVVLFNNVYIRISLAKVAAPRPRPRARAMLIPGTLLSVPRKP